MATITLPEDEEQIDDVNGFYFMANHSTFNGDPILTLQINNGKNRSIKLKKKKEEAQYFIIFFMIITFHLLISIQTSSKQLMWKTNYIEVYIMKFSLYWHLA